MVVNLLFTPVEDISTIRDALQETFSTGKTIPLAWRRNQLRQLARLCQDNADAIVQALQEDLGKPALETLVTEVGVIIERSLLSAERLEEWAKPEYPDVPESQRAWKPTLYRNPKGVVLLISPFNFPCVLAFQPLIGAIAAGCPAVIKPSELVPCFSQWLAETLPKYLDKSAYRIVNGGVLETTRLLELPWGHIFYTGNGTVARIISAAAAKNLTPLTLELGGKSPVIIDPAVDIDIAAKRILWAKCNNAGQICVAPDYVLVTPDRQHELVEAFKRHYNTFFPEGALKSSSYGRIVSARHFQRIKSLLDRTKGDIVLGGQLEGTRGIEPTIVINVPDGDSLMEEEIFGPVLPILSVGSMDEAVQYVRKHPSPLAVYAFTENSELKEKLVRQTLSGAIVFNDVFQQLAVNELPFTGVGESGCGTQILKYTYDQFTHYRSSIDVPFEVEPSLVSRYAPYQYDSGAYTAMIDEMVYRTIPDNE